MPISYDSEKGVAYRLNSGGEWEPTKIAKNPETGEAFALDGEDWKAIKVSAVEGDKMTKNGGAEWDGLRTFADGMLFSLGDELSAAAAATKESLSGGLDWSDAYDQALSMYRGARGDYQDENPVTSTALEMAGAVVPAAATLGIAAPAAGSRLALAGVNAATGAAEGAAYGFGSGEGGGGERLKSAGAGAALGGLAGAAAPAALGLVGKGVKAAAKPITRRLGKGPATLADRKLLEAIEADGMDVTKARDELMVMGDDSMIADLGPNTTDLSRTLMSRPGEALNEGTKALTERQVNIGRNLNKSVKENLGVDGDYYAQAKAIEASRKAKADKFYGASKQEAPVFQSPEIKALIKDNKVLSDAIKKAKEFSEFKNKPEMSWELLDEAYKLVGSKANKARMSGDNRLATKYSKVRNDLRDLMGKESPSYPQALKAYSEDSITLDAMKMGRDFLKGDIEIAEQQLDRLVPEDRVKFLEGVYRALSDKIDNRPLTGDISTQFNNDAIRRRLRAVAGDDAAEEIIRQAELAGRKSNTFKQSLQGSNTARIQASQQVESLDPDLVSGLVADLSISPTFAAMNVSRSLVKKAVEWGRSMPPRERAALAKSLYSTDKTAQREALDRLARRAEVDGLSKDLVTAFKRLTAAEAGLLVGREQGE